MGYPMENKERIILITGAGGELLKYDKPRQQLKKYSKMHGFHFEFKKFKDNYKLEKLEMIRKWIDQDYTVIWVDYDIKILNYTKNIMDAINNNKLIYVASHRIQPAHKINNIILGNEFFQVENSGVMVFVSNNITKLFIYDMLYLTKNYYLKVSCWNDNSALLNLIDRKKIISYFSKLSEYLKLVCVPNFREKKYKRFIGHLDNKFNCIFGINTIKEDTVFIHYAGMKDRSLYLR